MWTCEKLWIVCAQCGQRREFAIVRGVYSWMHRVDSFVSSHANCGTWNANGCPDRSTGAEYFRIETDSEHRSNDHGKAES